MLVNGRSMIWRFGSGRRMPTRVCLELGTVCPLHPSEAATPVYGALNAMPVPATAHRGDRTGPLAPTANCHSVFGGPTKSSLESNSLRGTVSRRHCFKRVESWNAGMRVGTKCAVHIGQHTRRNVPKNV